MMILDVEVTHFILLLVTKEQSKEESMSMQVGKVEARGQVKGVSLCRGALTGMKLDVQRGS